QRLALLERPDRQPARQGPSAHVALDGLGLDPDEARRLEQRSERAPERGGPGGLVQSIKEAAPHRIPRLLGGSRTMGREVEVAEDDEAAGARRRDELPQSLGLVDQVAERQPAMDQVELGLG